jgi:gamma-glutamylcyclotransferase (GGCT)/AIG2-like uncharacterized protein YtfP
MSGNGSSHLFVYGSLRPSIGHQMGKRLANDARLVGAATIRGQLYAISWYPGLIDSDDPADIVHGDVFELTAPDATLEWLDHYEGIVQGPASVAAAAEYVRAERGVLLADGRAVTAWVYLFQQSTSGRRRIHSGDWSRQGPD